MTICCLLAAAVCAVSPATASQSPADTLAAHNRTVFERLFGGDNAPQPARDTVTITRVGTAVDHPDRSHKAIHDVAYTHLETARSMYRRRLLVKPRLKGEVKVVFRILPDGTVTDVHTAGSTLDDEKLEQGLVAAIGTWRFVPIGAEHGDVTVSYPFRFSPE